MEQEKNSVVADMLADIEPADNEEESQETKAEESSKEETKEETKENVITEELAKEFGVSTSMVGQPMSKLAEVYKRKTQEFTQTQQENLTLKTQYDELQNQKKEIKEETGFNVDDIPDPLDDPEGFKKALKSALKKQDISKDMMAEIRKELKEELLKEISPRIQPAEELALKNRIAETMTAIQNGLPKGVKVEDVLDEWKQENEETIQAYVESGMYAKNPKLFIKHVLDFYKSSSYDSLQKTNQKVIDEEVHKRLKKQTQKETSVKPTHQREETKESGLISEIADDLMKQKGF